MLSAPAQRAAPAAGLTLRDKEFALFQQWIHAVAGISMSDAKKALVAGRLARRVQERGLPSFEAYFQLLQRDAGEHQIALDLLTTNETHFFREPKHFELLRDVVLPEHAAGPGGRALRIWSAASSTGQEPYSLAMLLAHQLGDVPWEILGSDICTRALERARSALYDLALTREIPDPLLRAYCLKGVGAHSGHFLIAPELSRRVRFAQINLNTSLPDVGEFDIIFLRNVMIYFDEATKRAVVRRLLEALRPGGWFIVGHSETLHGLTPQLRAHGPSVYRKQP